jgi:hypothetical protein
MYSSVSTTTLTVEPQRYFVTLYGAACLTIVVTLICANAAPGLTFLVGGILAICTWRAAIDPASTSTIRVVFEQGQPQVRAWVAGRWYRDVLARVEASSRWFVRLSLAVPDRRAVVLLVFWPVTSSASLRKLRLWALSLPGGA